jgi:hypothetical protein
MNSLIKPISLGIVTYILTAIGLWFVLSLIFSTVSEKVLLLVPITSALIALLVSGYITSINLKTHKLSQKITYSSITGIIGFSLSLLITQAKGEISLLIFLLLGAAAVSAFGGLIGGRKNVL